MILYYILIVALPLIEHPFWGAKLGGITLEKYLGGACLAYAILESIARRRVPHFLRTPHVRAVFLFFCVAAVSYAYLGAVNQSDNMMVIYGSHAIFLVTTMILVNSLERLRWTLLAAIFSVGCAAQYVLRDWRFGSALYGASYRPGYITGDSNYFTASVVLFLPIAYYFALEERIRWQRWFAIGCLTLCLPAIILGGSRGGLLGVVATALVVVYRSRRRRRNFVCISIVLASLMAAMPSSPLRRLMNPTRSDIRSTDVRFELWRAGWKMIQAHPILGIGLGNFKAVVSTYADPGLDLNNIAHNTYVETAAELGVPGLLSFLAILLFAFVSLGRVRRRARKCNQELICRTASGLQAGLLGFCVSIFFVSAEFLKMFWFAVFLSACLPSLLIAAERRRREIDAALPARSVSEPDGFELTGQSGAWSGNAI